MLSNNLSINPFRVILLFCQLVYFLVFDYQNIQAQNTFTPWYGQERALRYQPEGDNFVIKNGDLKFNRALYGGNTGFRVEAGDLPEFALYLPGMGGNMKFGIISGVKSIWVTDAQSITTKYNAGLMNYEINDPVLGDGSLIINVLSMYQYQGIIIRIKYSGTLENIKLLWVFGGATGKRFSRDGDIGADPESVFYLSPEYCFDNEYEINENQFVLHYGSGRTKTNNEIYENNYKLTDEEKKTSEVKFKKQLIGIAPAGTNLKIGNAKKQETPVLLLNSEKSETPIVSGLLSLSSATEMFFSVYVPQKGQDIDYKDLAVLYNKTNETRKSLANRIKIQTPDKYINLIGSTLSMAADAIWEEPCYQHGAVAWRMPLPGWRGAYAADWLGWHDRARMHLSEYAKAQYISPDSSNNFPDPNTNLSRQAEQEGVSIFTSGYISRKPSEINKPHHYDMNLVYIDQLIWHFNWTGDTAFMRKMWPVIQRHQAWEKRSFDPDNDGLYNAYCCIWASDALQYSGGGVTHSTAYNYRSNVCISRIAEILGENPEPYLKEAEKIKKAVNSQLWLPESGVYAENKDLLGLKQAHTVPALWTIYHAIDAGLPDNCQAYQATRYIDTQIPHIPIEAIGIPKNEYYTLSTSNWMPYTWSINNVTLAENLNTSLAYWQSGRTNEAFKLWKSQFIESMFLGSSPGNFQQLSFYDAFRGELYRDFADPIGVSARTIVEGLFGIVPNAMDGNLLIRPGLPDEWNFASIETPDISCHFKREAKIDSYTIIPKFVQKMTLKFRFTAVFETIRSIKINGKETKWNIVEDAIGQPIVELNLSYLDNYEIRIEWANRNLEKPEMPDFIAADDEVSVLFKKQKMFDIYDPQNALNIKEINGKSLKLKASSNFGNKSVFIKVKQGQMQWWIPWNFELRRPIEIIANKNQEANSLRFKLQNNTGKTINAQLSVGDGKVRFEQNLSFQPFSNSDEITIPSGFLVTGSNQVFVKYNNEVYEGEVINWNFIKKDRNFEAVDLTNIFNDKVSNIFKNQYISPRSPYPTVQIPIQGIGDWCSFKELPEIDDSGLRKRAGRDNKIELEQGISFSTPDKSDDNNIIFTSLWDNYPNSVSIPLSGNASHIYLLMAGSTHHMQSRFVNGIIKVNYTDGSYKKLELKNPDTWWPIEQDYYDDGFAFSIDAPRPIRLYLKTGISSLKKTDVLSRNKTIKIEGGAATIFDLSLNSAKTLKNLELITTANDVVIGLMSITLSRP